MTPDDLGERLLSRRNLLTRGATLGAALPLASLLAACGDDSGGTGSTASGSTSAARGPVSGTAVFLNTPGWIGPNTIRDFERLHSGVTITERGSVRNPLFRFVSRFIMGHTASIDLYLRALGEHFGSEPIPQVVDVPRGTHGL